MLVRETHLDTVSAHVIYSKGNAGKLHSYHTDVQSRDTVNPDFLLSTVYTVGYIGLLQYIV